MDAFRYEMFARRLVAAEYGRPDAVEWAQSWYNDVLAEEHRIAEEKQRQTEDMAARAEFARAEFKAGRCGNPRYQAFLDTIEHPELLESNAPYLAWSDRLVSKFESIHGVDYLPGPERKALWLKFLQDERDANLAPRLKAKVPPSQ